MKSEGGGPEATELVFSGSFRRFHTASERDVLGTSERRRGRGFIWRAPGFREREGGREEEEGGGSRLLRGNFSS